MLPAGMRYALVALIAAAAMIVAGCASIDPERESDIPWNVPQSWEGSPAIPGFGN